MFGNEFTPKSLIDLKNITPDKLLLFFQTIKNENQFNETSKENFVKEKKSIDLNFKNKTAALIFLESSTRTRFSFETACIANGIYPMILDGSKGTSLEKGETILDTLKNLEAMKPLFFIIRCQQSEDLKCLSELIKTPIINAGWGVTGHPTQALLDFFTLFQKWDELRGKKILYIGDIKHSRVVQSHREMANIFGIQMGLCTSKSFLPDWHLETENFDDIQKGIKWADAIYLLRVQKERHFEEMKFDIDKFQFKNEHLKLLTEQKFILHPGPINFGVELEAGLDMAPQSLIYKQVENGVLVRKQIIKSYLNSREIF